MVRGHDLCQPLDDKSNAGFVQELDAMDECVACLQRASDLARENRQHFGDDIAMATRIAKRKRWNALGE